MPLRSYVQLAWSPDGAKLGFAFDMGSFGLLSFEQEKGSAAEVERGAEGRGCCLVEA